MLALLAGLVKYNCSFNCWHHRLSFSRVLALHWGTVNMDWSSIHYCWIWRQTNPNVIWWHLTDNWQFDNTTDQSASMFIGDVILLSEFWRRNCWLNRCDTIWWTVTFSGDNTARKSGEIYWQWDQFIEKDGEERSRVEVNSQLNRRLRTQVSDTSMSASLIT